MNDIEIALLNMEDSIRDNANKFPPDSRSVVVWTGDLKVLMAAARAHLDCTEKGKD